MSYFLKHQKKKFFQFYAIKNPSRRDVERVQIGMTMEQVKEIMPYQVPGPQASLFYQDGSKTVYMWRLADTAGAKFHHRQTVEIAFVDEKVVYVKIA